MKVLLAMLSLMVGPMFAQNAPTVRDWNASNIVWQSSEPDGTKHATLEGDRNVAGKPYTYAMLIPAGAWDDHPHIHNHDTRVFVVSGALLLDVGPNSDKKTAKSYPAGSFVLVPGNLEHTMGAETETLIVGTTEGGFETHEHMHPKNP